jgi:hypothetical protein
MYDRALVTPLSRWMHVKTKSTYTALGVSRCSTNGPGEGVECVVYWSDTYRGLRHRDADEFLDGRFVPLASQSGDVK